MTNDDGVLSPGIRTLAAALAARGWLEAVVAPDRERSGMGHAITVDRPLRAKPLADAPYPQDIPVLACDGTPTDCVSLGADLLYPAADCVVSGINQGPNLGDDVTYSGTVCAAMEGVLLDRPSVAVSLCLEDGETIRHNETAARAALAVLELLPLDRKKPALWNVNVPNLPPEKLKGFRVTRMGERRYTDKFTATRDPRGNDCYWISGKIRDCMGEGADVTAVAAGYVAVTPITLDMTDYSCLNAMREETAQERFEKAFLQEIEK